MRPILFLPVIALILLLGCRKEPAQPVKSAAAAKTLEVEDLGQECTFFGLPVGRAQRIVFLVDASGSMTDGLEYVTPELKRCISSLREDQRFSIILYNEAPHQLRGGMVEATAANKRAAAELVGSTVPFGKTNAGTAIESAFAMGPDLVYLLSDGEITQEEVDLAKRLSAEKKVRINTICMPVWDVDLPLRLIAKYSGGVFLWLSEQELAKFAAADTPQGPTAPAKVEPTKPPADRSFFKIPIGDAHKVVFVIDGGGSMTDTLDCVKYELKRCVGQLTKEDLFDILFVMPGPPSEMPPKNLVHATDENKKAAGEFLDGAMSLGCTDPVHSLKRAFALKPDAIIYLTDGEDDRSLVELVKRLNADGKVSVHTICFLYKMGEAVLKQIANQNGGTYKFVSEADLNRMFPLEQTPKPASAPAKKP